MLKVQLLIILVACLSHNFQQLQAAKILAIFGMPHPVENQFASALLNAINERGHELTVIIRFSNNLKLHKNIKKIEVDATNELFMDFFTVSGKNFGDSLLGDLQKFFNKNALLTLKAMKNPSVEQMMKHDRFDLILFDTFMSEALYGLGEYFNAPMIGVSNFLTLQALDDLVGNFSPISTIPSIYIQHTFDTKFSQRFLNVALNVFDKQIFNYFHYSNQNKLYRELFPNNALSFDQARKNFSLVLLNQHFSLSFPRPYVPNMIEVAGLHITEKSDMLPLEVQRFLNDSLRAVIFISLSMDGQTLDIKPNRILLQKIFYALRDLNYKVIWHMDHLPVEGYNCSHILSVSNVSRISVLKQPQVKLLITSGDIQSIIEAVYYAKPVLGLPLFGDQHLNMNMATKAGYGLSMKFITLSENKIANAVLELLNNSQYFRNIKHLSQIFRDQPMEPKRKAIYWIEYVLRHKGAPHLMSKGRFLNFWQFHNIDVITLYFVIIVCCIFISWLVLKFLNYSIGKMRNNSQLKIKTL